MNHHQGIGIGITSCIYYLHGNFWYRLNIFSISIGIGMDHLPSISIIMNPYPGIGFSIGFVTSSDVGVWIMVEHYMMSMAIAGKKNAAGIRAFIQI